jgi:choice-of-anchor B domain-containing protein
MKSFPLLVLILILHFNIHSQTILNMDLVSNLNYPQNCNDIWGYVHQDGTEYAILGTVTGTAIISLADPENPNEVLFIPGATSVWRDMKNWNDHIYVTTDQGTDGLLIIDMADAPNNITYSFWKPEIDIRGQLSILHTCHNLYIDENGYCYLAGCNMNAGGVLIVDVHSIPGEPQFVSACDPRYSHDAMVRGDTLYSSDITSGFFSIIDVTDKIKPVTIAIQRTSFEFTHNAWVSDDGKYLFTTDERPNGYVDAYDISDLEDIRRVDRIRPLSTEGTGVIPHNVHYFDGYLVISWYTDGVIVVDASHPDHLVKVGQYDTYLPSAGGFNGCWGAYPWLPSGLLLGSDMNTGLYVLQPKYIRASRITGIVRDAISGLVLAGVTVEIDDEQSNKKNTDITGRYKSGIAGSGEKEILFSLPGYYDQLVTVNLQNGEIMTLDINLQPLPKIQIRGIVIDKSNGLPISEANVFVKSISGEIIVQTDDLGRFEIDASKGHLELIAGKWGYIYYHDTLTSFENEYLVTTELERGYQDHFVFDYGWVVSGGAARGQWERGVPEATFFNGIPSNPGNAFPIALGEKCYVTGLAGGGAGDHDLDDGFAILSSPTMNLKNALNPRLQFAYWFFNDGGFGNPNDSLVIKIRNESTVVEIAKITNSTNGWVLSNEINLNDIIDLDENVKIIFQASDLPGTGHLVEAAIDYFTIYQDPISSTNSNSVQKSWSIFPNPSTQQFHINLKDRTASKWHITDMTGKTVLDGKIYIAAENITIYHKLNNGLYFISLFDEAGVSMGVEKIIVAGN